MALEANFAIFSENATAVDLCLFDEAGHETRLPPQRGWVKATSGMATWPTLAPASVTGYRVHGPYDPENGLRFNPHKLLLDPYARAIEGDVTYGESIFSYDISRVGKTRVWKIWNLNLFRTPKRKRYAQSVVVDPSFDLGRRSPPGDSLAPPSFTRPTFKKALPSFIPMCPDHLRGKPYAGLAHLRRDRASPKGWALPAVEHYPSNHFQRYPGNLVAHGCRN